MTANPSNPTGVQLKSKISVFDGYVNVDRYQISHQLYGGGWSKTLEREVISRGAVVGVLLFDPTRQEVVLVEQFRIGAWATDWPDPWLLECVAGVVEPGERPAGGCRPRSNGRGRMYHHPPGTNNPLLLEPRIEHGTSQIFSAVRSMQQGSAATMASPTRAKTFGHQSGHSTRR